MDIKLIAFDIDGTLLTTDKKLLPRMVDALYAADKKGILLVPSTGRTYTKLPEKLLELDFIRYIISINGALVYDRQEEESIYDAPIPHAFAMEVLDYMKSLGVIYECFAEGCSIVDRKVYDSYDEYITDKVNLAFLRASRLPVDDLEGTLKAKKCDIQKLMMFFKDMDERARQLELLPKLYPRLAVSSSIAGNIEMNYYTATKGLALKAICDREGIDISGAAAFGDGTNDISMIRAAGFGVAMENAPDEVKLAADYIAPHCDSCGMADTIEKIISGEI